MQQVNNENITKPGEISVHDIILKTRYAKAHLKSKWKLIILFTLLMAILGLAYSIFVKPRFTAVCTFVLDDGDRSGALGQYAGLASLAGIDLGGGGGIFKGDNILELYKSRSMIKKALLSDGQFNGKQLKLIDRYIAYNHLLEKWKKQDDIEQITFANDPDKFNRTQDSIITDIAETFNKKSLEVSKPDKKLSVIRVAFTNKDELFAKAFTDNLVNNVNRFYIETRTKKTAQNVWVLQHQADSVKQALNSSIGGAASALDAAPNANPALLSLRVPSQKKQVDVQANTAIYSEIIKNLEITKISLRQQTPLIQFIDQPVFPLDNNRVGKVRATTAGALAGFTIIVLFLITVMVFRAFMKRTI
jgi:hypothetical protein